MPLLQPAPSPHLRSIASRRTGALDRQRRRGGPRSSLKRVSPSTSRPARALRLAKTREIRSVAVAKSGNPPRTIRSRRTLSMSGWKFSGLLSASWEPGTAPRRYSMPEAARAIMLTSTLASSLVLTLRYLDREIPHPTKKSAWCDGPVPFKTSWKHYEEARVVTIDPSG